MEEQLDTILEEGSISAKSKKQEIIYYRPKFHRRIMANLLDIIFFAFTFFSLFLLNRYIVGITPTYKANTNSLNEIRLNSGIYMEDGDSQITDIITVLNSDTNFNTEYKKKAASGAIDKFLNYASTVCDEEIYQIIAKDYDDYRLDSSMVYNNTSSSFNGAALFVLDEDNNIMENPELLEPSNYVPSIYGYYYENAYAPYIDDHLQGYLVTSIPNYYDLVKYFSNMLIYADLMPAYLVSGILIYYLPMLIFTRGRTTFGKAIYRIGLVDSRVLSPKLGRISARFAIFYFAELILSIFTFGIPYLISFSLMVFSKEKQGFPDYMLRLIEIDMSRTKIYKSFDEADLDKVNSHREPINFNVPNYD